MADRIHQNSSAAYDFLLRSTADGFIIADTDSLIIYMNPAAAAMLSKTVDDVVGKTPDVCFEENTALLALFRQTSEEKRNVPLPRRRLAQGIADTMPTGERVILLQDITEQHDLETRREMLSKTIAHDLRNPLSAIGGFVELVGKFGDLNTQQQKYVLRAKQTSGKIHDMIVTLVDLAWIEAGMPLKHVPIRLDDAIQRAIREIQPIAKKQSIGIATSLQTPLPMLMGDPERLHAVIYHLLHNAVMYSLKPEKNVVIHAWGDEQEIYCSVADQGIGITENEIGLVFDRMYRSRDERVREITGGGLGLTIAKTIVERHGGDIWVTSKIDEGSTFTFSLPAVEV